MCQFIISKFEITREKKNCRKSRGEGAKTGQPILPCRASLPQAGLVVGIIGGTGSDTYSPDYIPFFSLASETHSPEPSKRKNNPIIPSRGWASRVHHPFYSRIRPSQSWRAEREQKTNRSSPRVHAAPGYIPLFPLTFGAKKNSFSYFQTLKMLGQKEIKTKHPIMPAGA